MLVCQHWPTKRIQDGPVSVPPSFVICDGSSKSLLGLQIHTMENILKSNFWSEVFFKVKQMWCRWEQLESPVCKAVQRGCCLSPRSLLVQLGPALHQGLPRPVVHSDLFGSTTFAGRPLSGARLFADYPYEFILGDFILLLFREVCFAAYQRVS